MNKEKTYLYSPWRLDYILAEKPEDCILCRHIDPKLDKENLIVYRSSHCYVMLNRYPYNNGHLMVVPYQHTNRLCKIENEILFDLMAVLKLSDQALYNVYKCHGINVGLNEGAAAGAGIGEHLHFHLVPRWEGDNSFMTVVSGERVIPEPFETAFVKISQEFSNLLSIKE